MYKNNQLAEIFIHANITLSRVRSGVKKLFVVKNLESQKLCSSVSIAMEIAVVTHICHGHDKIKGRSRSKGWGVTKHKFTRVLYCFANV